MHEKSQKDKNLALFDFDGTLCAKDSFTGFIFYVHAKRHILKQGIKILPWIQAYYLKLYPAHAMRPKLYQAMFKQSSCENIEMLAQEYAQQLKYALDPELYAQLKRHQALGHDVFLVSASLDLYLQPICQALNIGLICTQVEKHTEYLTGYYATADCSGQEKVNRLLAQVNINDYENIYAYGNSSEDLDMLAIAHHAYMVGQDQSLPCLASI